MSSAKEPPKTRAAFERGLVTSDDATKIEFGALVDPSHNFRIGELGSIRPRDGYEIAVALPTAFTPVGKNYYEDSITGFRAPVVSDGSSVYALEQAGWLLVGTFPSSGTIFRSEMHDGYLAMVNGAAQPHQLRRLGANSWEFREIGLDVPPSPNSSGATSLIPLPDPTGITQPHYLAMHPTLGGGGSVLAASADSTGFAAFDIGGAIWANKASKPDFQAGLHQLLGRMSTGRVIQAPALYSGAAPGNAAIAKRTYYWDPAGNSWSSSKPFADNLYWALGSSFATSPAPWAGQDFILTYFGQANTVAWQLFRISEGATTTTSIGLPLIRAQTGAGVNVFTYYDAVLASRIVATATPNILYVLETDGTVGPNVTRLWRADVGASPTITTTGIAQPSFVLGVHDQVVYNGGDEFLVYLEGTTTIHRYRISANAWDVLPAEVTAHFRGMVGGFPTNSLLYHFLGGAGADFAAKTVPGGGGGGGGGGGSDFKVAVTLIDNTGHESTASAAFQVNDVPAGAPIGINIPISPFSYVVARRIYSTLADDLDGPLFRVADINDNTTTITTISSNDADRLRTLPTSPTDNTKPPAGPDLVTSFAERLILAGFTADRALLAMSKSDNSHAFPDTLQQTFKSRGRVMALLRGSGYLAVPLTSSTTVYPGDPGTVDSVLRLTDVGCEATETGFEVDDICGWLSERGLIAFDGFNARRIDPAVSDLSSELRGATRRATVAFRRLVRWFYQDPADATKTKVLIHDAERDRWLLDRYPAQFRAVAANAQDISLSGPVVVQVDNLTNDFDVDADVFEHENVGSGQTITAGLGTNVLTLVNPLSAGTLPGAAVSVDGIVYGITAINVGLQQITTSAVVPAGPGIINWIRGTLVAGGRLTMRSTTNPAGAQTIIDTSLDMGGEDDVQAGAGLENVAAAGQIIASITGNDVVLTGTMSAKAVAGTNVKFIGNATVRRIMNVTVNTLRVDDASGLSVNQAVEWIRGGSVSGGVLGLTSAPSADSLLIDVTPHDTWFVDQQISQTFLFAVNTRITRVDLKLRQAGGYRIQFVEIRQGTPVGDGSNGTLISSVFNNPAGFVYSGDGTTFETFMVPGGGVDLTGGTQYYVRTGVAAGSGFTYSIFINQTNPYAGGNIFSMPGNGGSFPGSDMCFRMFGSGGAGVIYPTNQYYEAKLTPTPFPNLTDVGATFVNISETVPASTSSNWKFKFSAGGPFRYWTGAAWADFIDPGTTPMSAATVNALTAAQWKSAGGFSVGSPYLEPGNHLRSTVNTSTPTVTQVTVTWEQNPASLFPTTYVYRAVLQPITAYAGFLNFPAQSWEALGEILTANANLRYAFRFFAGDVDRFHNGASWVPVANRMTDGMTRAAVLALTDAQWQSANGFVSGTPRRQASIYLWTTNNTEAPSLDGTRDSYNQQNNPSQTVFEGLSVVDGTNMYALDRGSTDNGTAITASITPITFSTNDTDDDVNWDSAHVDLEAPGAYNIGVQTRIDDGAPRTLQPIQSTSGGTRGEFRRFPLDHVGRRLRTTFTVPHGVRFNKCFIRGRDRGRR